MTDHQDYSYSSPAYEEETEDTDILDNLEFSDNSLVEATEKNSDELLIECVRSYPHLFDKRNRDYKDLIKRNNSWSEIAGVVNINAAECQRKWLLLRTRFSREKKLRQEEFKSGSGATKKAPWDLYKHMEFLNPHVLSRKMTSNYKPTSTTVTVVESPTTSELASESSKSSMNNLKQATEIAPNCQNGERSTFKKRKTLADVDLSLLNMSAAVTSHFKNDQNKIIIEDEDDIFSKLIAVELKKMAQADKIEAKGKILKIIYNL